MKILSYDENKDVLEKSINQNFPFCFFKEYSLYVSKVERKKIIFFIDSNQNISSAKLWNNKFIKLLQFEFPPLSPESKRLSAGDEKKFLENVSDLIVMEKTCDRILQPENYSLFYSYPEGSTHSPFGSYVIQLEGRRDEEILDCMQARYRSAIRNAIQLKPEIKMGESEIIPFHQLYEETMKRTGMHICALDELQMAYKQMPKNVLCANIYQDGQIQGGIFVYFSTYAGYYMHGASSLTTIASGHIKLLHYSLMIDLKNKGVKQYDFVGARLSDVAGTKLEGIQNFKSRFGSELKKGFLWKMDLNQTKCLIYDKMLNVKLKLKGKKSLMDIIDQELSKLN